LEGGGFTGCTQPHSKLTAAISAIREKIRYFITGQKRVVAVALIAG
jgi:hypothetical protein